MHFTVAVLVLLVGTVVNAAPISHTIKMNVSDVEESPLPAFFFLEVRALKQKRENLSSYTCVPLGGLANKALLLHREA